MGFLSVRLLLAQEALSDLLVAELSNSGYDSFQQLPKELIAFIQKENFDRRTLEACIAQYAMIGKTEIVEVLEIEAKTGNEEWEKHFEPVKIDNRIYVKASFHPEDPTFEHVIHLNPKMAFGTGHHETTYLMLQEMLEHDWNGKKVMDYGCGTGILAIMAEMLGGTEIEAIDNDPIAITNCKENTELNACKVINTSIGDKSAFLGKEFDLILANINRNILVESMEVMATSMHSLSILFLSGILQSDRKHIDRSTKDAGFVFAKGNNSWRMADARL